MWGPRLKYHLLGLGEAIRWLSSYMGPTLAGAQDAFLRCRYLDLFFFATTLPLVGVTWGAMLPLAPAYELRLTDEAIEPSNRHHLIMSYCIGRYVL
jgi:hypothetical protein